MDHNSPYNTWVGPQYQLTAATVSSSAVPAVNSQLLQQYQVQDQQQLGSFESHGLNLTYDPSTQASQNAQRKEDLLDLTSRSLLSLNSQALGEDDLQQLADEYAEYKLAICFVFQSIIKGHLEEASQQLLKASEWLLGHIERLALHIDDEASHYECRKQLWGNFNAAWLAIFQKQMDTLKDSGQSMRHPYNLMNREYINIMVKKLMSACDGIVKYGLIDYEYGVEEDKIIQVIIECLNLQETIESANQNQ